jgi:hypothetical protein
MHVVGDGVANSARKVLMAFAETRGRTRAKSSPVEGRTAAKI